MDIAYLDVTEYGLVGNQSHFCISETLGKFNTGVLKIIDVLVR